MTWQLKLAVWLGRRCGVDLRPWTGELDFAASQIEALTLALDKVTTAYEKSQQARGDAEAAYRSAVDGKVVPAPESVWSILPDAREACRYVEQHSAPGTSGEFKRHTALSLMMKRYPESSERDIALAIELAVRGLQDG